MMGIDLEFDKTNYESLDTFIKAMAEYFDVLKQLELRTFIFEFMNLYGEDALFAIENYQRLLEIIITSCIFNIRGAKDQRVDSVINKEVISLYNEINRVTSR